MLTGAFGKFITLCAGLIYLVCAVFKGNGWDSTVQYKKHVADFKPYENTLEEAVPQTEIYNYINGFFSEENGDGKEKKCIVVGYDGCRADMLSLAEEGESGILALLTDGGHAFLSYCGGTNWPEWNTQDTSTAPGWCSMLTGQWADVHGVTANDIVKDSASRTLLLSLVEEGKIDSSAFIVSWGGHFGDTDSVYDPATSNSTYCEEKDFAEKFGINAKFLRSQTDDDGTKAYTLAELAEDDCADFIFSIFEYPDHQGHTVGFSYFTEDYVKGFRDADKTALDVISAVEARDNYENEDWLIILTADHGGSTNGHGGPTIMERMTWIVSNKDLL